MHDQMPRLVTTLETALEAKLGGHEQEWTQTVERAIAALESALPIHTKEVERSDSPFVSLTEPVKGALPPNSRQLRRLRQDHADFAWWTHKLRGELKKVRHKLKVSIEPNAPHEQDLGNEPSEMETRLRNLRHRARYLVACLKHHCDTESQLLLERANTEVGGGD